MSEVPLYCRESHLDDRRLARLGREVQSSEAFRALNATVRGRAWYKLLDALVLTLNVTV